MFSQEEQQIEICLLKTNLEKIGDDLIVQNSALPALDAENEQKYRETMTALRAARATQVERERLNLDNMKLTAKRMQLKRQCDDIAEALERAREDRCRLTDSLREEERQIELAIRQYEDSLREKAERFRQTSIYYNEEEMSLELKKLNDIIKELECEMKRQENFVEDLKRGINSLEADVPENLINQLGKLDIDEEVKTVTTKHETLSGQLNNLLNSRNCK